MPRRLTKLQGAGRHIDENRLRIASTLHAKLT